MTVPYGTFAIEAAAIAAYESFVRNQQHGRDVQYPDWGYAGTDTRNHWRTAVKGFMTADGVIT
jgi:hypothetical protein